MPLTVNALIDKSPIFRNWITPILSKCWILINQSMKEMSIWRCNLWRVTSLLSSSIHKLSNRNGYLNDLQKKIVFIQIVSGVAYLHSAKLMHRDIKPSNILVGSNCEAKLCDFGLIRAF